MFQAEEGSKQTDAITVISERVIKEANAGLKSGVRGKRRGPGFGVVWDENVGCSSQRRLVGCGVWSQEPGERRATPGREAGRQFHSAGSGNADL